MGLQLPVCSTSHHPCNLSDNTAVTSPLQPACLLLVRVVCSAHLLCCGTSHPDKHQIKCICVCVRRNAMQRPRGQAGDESQPLSSPECCKANCCIYTDRQHTVLVHNKTSSHRRLNRRGKEARAGNTVQSDAHINSHNSHTTAAP